MFAAARSTCEALLRVAGDMLEIDPAGLDVADGEVAVRGDPDRRVPVSDVAAAATWTYGTIITGSGAWMKPFSAPDPDTGECDPHAAISYAACVADVEVDDETGEVTVLRLARPTTSAARSTRCSSRNVEFELLPVRLRQIVGGADRQRVERLVGNGGPKVFGHACPRRTAYIDCVSTRTCDQHPHPRQHGGRHSRRADSPEWYGSYYTLRTIC